MDKSFLPVVRELARAYQAFANYSAAHVRELGLTPSQFDVIATLGNTPGMPFHKLAEQTLITKGTLTGIIDRLEEKGLVRREVPTSDRRSYIAVLTPAGQQVFAQAFPAHLAYLSKCFQEMAPAELEETCHILRRLRKLF